MTTQTGVPTIAFVIAAFNRRETTLRSLASLYNQEGLGEDWNIEVFLLDDASPDGTAMAVAEAYPGINLLQGTGALFWGGGMNRAMVAALQSNPDFVVLFNDDVILKQDAVMRVLSEHDEAVAATKDPMQVIVGPTTDPATGTISYSGFARTHRRDPSKIVRLLPSSSRLVPCDTMNGNFVLIPAAVFKSLGAIDATFIQQLGDLDYGYRVRAAGGSVLISRLAVGTCAPNTRMPPWRKPDLGLIGRWRAINTPLGLPLRPWFTFMWRWGGAEATIRLVGIYFMRMIGR